MQTTIETRFWDKQYHDYLMNDGPKPPPHPLKTHEWNIELWEDELKEYINNDGPKPGPHPLKDHVYNKDPTHYLSLKIE